MSEESGAKMGQLMSGLDEKGLANFTTLLNHIGELGGGNNFATFVSVLNTDKGIDSFALFLKTISPDEAIKFAKIVQRMMPQEQAKVAQNLFNNFTSTSVAAFAGVFKHLTVDTFIASLRTPPKPKTGCAVFIGAGLLMAGWLVRQAI